MPNLPDKTPVQDGFVAASPPPRAGHRLLIGALIALVLVYLFLQPYLRRVQDETERINRKAALDQAQADRIRAQKAVASQIETLAALKPNDADAQMALAQYYAETGRSKLALPAAEAAHRLQPDDVNILLTLATLRQKARHYDAAMDAYREALTQSPDEPRAQAGLASLYVLLGWPIRAENLLLPAIKALPDNAQLRVTLALAYVQHENYKAAEDLLLAIRREYPNDVALWSPLANTYYLQKRFAEAQQTADEILRVSPENVPVLTTLAQASYKRGEIDRARFACQRWFALSPDDPEAHYLMGMCAQSENKADEAIQNLEWVEKRNPDYKGTRQALRALYLSVNRPEDAQRMERDAAQSPTPKADLSKLTYKLAGRPDDAALHRQVAQAYQQTGDFSRAIVEWKEVLLHNPQDAAARNQLKQALKAAHREEEADRPIR